MTLDAIRLAGFPLLAIATFGVADVHGQALTLEQAKTAMDAAEAEARRNGWNLTIVVAGADGIPVVLRRMDGASPRSYDIAMAKVRTAIAAGMPTGDYGQALAAGGTCGHDPERHHLRGRLSSPPRRRGHRGDERERRPRLRGRAGRSGRHGRDRHPALTAG
jgi:hypothetical protein